MLEADDISLSAGDKLLLADATIVIERGEKVALVGPNGSRKTTLLEAILGRDGPDGGTIALGHGVVPAYFSQHTQELPRRGSVLDATTAETGLTRPQAQTLLGRFLFSGWETHGRTVTALSGGERRRLALALLVASGANFLVLDSRRTTSTSRAEALEAALEAFPGTVLIVSHDRALLDAVHRPHRRHRGRHVALVRRRLGRQGSSGCGALAGAEATRREARQAPAATIPPEARPSVGARTRGGGDRGGGAPHRRAGGRLAGDWSDMDVLTAHRAARDELQKLLLRWEVLFEDASTR